MNIGAWVQLITAITTFVAAIGALIASFKTGKVVTEINQKLSNFK